ncbi:MAG: argininosuccinate lyase [Bacteroidetes bacterium RBG_19FT_COMBO_42_7]|nr:MAG: argininosuccinate lyase [Bacteroidetes bacterium RBG_19FT_COMBO_42_7]
MKLWEKGVIPDPSVIEFTSGRDRTTDLCLAEWDIAGSMAHAIMLREAGLITDTEKEGLLKTLYSLFKKVKERKYVIEDGVEDIHSQVEKDLTRALGDSGKKIHTGRSRNDQVLVDIRLYTRKEIDALASNVSRLFKKFQVLSEQHKEEMMPGYTHMQPAMASSFGLWFGSYAECLADDILLLSAARAFNDRNPLGSGAGYGSTLPLNRKLTTALLEFDGLLFNSAYANLSRGKAELATASAMASIAQTLSRFSMDVCLFMTAEFRFIDFPDEYITGSSIMPQKRNPDVFELIRGRANLIQTLPGQISVLISGLPSGYNRELQLLKQLIFNAFNELKECIDIMIVMLDHIRITKEITADPAYNSIFSTEEVNRLVKEGMPFRDAYKKVAGMIGKEVFSKTSITEYTHEGSIGNLCNEEIRRIFEERIKCFKSKSSAELVGKLIKMQ